jgi:hypothetical protein
VFSICTLFSSYFLLFCPFMYVYPLSLLRKYLDTSQRDQYTCINTINVGCVVFYAVRVVSKE